MTEASVMGSYSFWMFASVCVGPIRLLQAVGVSHYRFSNLDGCGDRSAAKLQCCS